MVKGFEMVEYNKVVQLNKNSDKWGRGFTPAYGIAAGIYVTTTYNTPLQEVWDIECKDRESKEFKDVDKFMETLRKVTAVLGYRENVYSLNLLSTENLV